MSYTVLTPAYYDAVIAGALGGMMNGQASTSTSQESELPYNVPVNAALALAQEIDTRLGVLTSTVAKANVLNELCGAWMNNRYPSGNPNSAVPTSYVSIANAIIACWTIAISNLA